MLHRCPLRCACGIAAKLMLNFFQKLLKLRGLNKCVSGNGSENLGRVGTHIFFYFFISGKNIIVYIAFQNA